MRLKRKKKNETARRAGLAAVAAGLLAAIAGLAGRRRKGAAGSEGRGGRFGRRDKRETFTCESGQAYRVTGVDRHRVYWAEGAGRDEPVMGDTCVACDRPLPVGHDTAVAG
jgi:hypothetical protein